MEFANTESLRVYGIACRFKYEDEMKIASKHTTSICLPELDELPEELKFIPAMEYHRLTVLHAKHRKEVVEIAELVQWVYVELSQRFDNLTGIAEIWKVEGVTQEEKQKIVDLVKAGTPLNYESLTRAVAKGRPVFDAEFGRLVAIIRHVLKKADELNMTV